MRGDIILHLVSNIIILYKLFNKRISYSRITFFFFLFFLMVCTFGSLEDEKDAEGYANEVKLLGRSKWSNETDEDVTEETGAMRRGNANALSGLIQAYGKEGKSVRWGDQVFISLTSHSDQPLLSPIKLYI